VTTRPQVGIDLLVQRAGQEAQVLARFDRRPGQDDPVDLLALQRLDRLGHGQVGLAGAGRADAEDDRVLVDRVHVPLLVQGLGPDRLAPVGQDVLGQHLGRAGVLAGVQHGADPLHRVRGQALAGAQDRDQLGEHLDRQGHRGRLAGQGDLVAADVDAGLEVALENAQELVARAEHVDHLDRIGNGDPARAGARGRGDLARSCQGGRLIVTGQRWSSLGTDRFSR
jgi:hypothetical protein